MESIREQARKLALHLDHRKGMNISLLDVQGICSIADYFLIATGTSARHVLALADYAEAEAEGLGLGLRHKEGHRTGDWIILDYADIVIHLFVQETRDYYGLERIWRDAQPVELPLDTGFKAL